MHLHVYTSHRQSVSPAGCSQSSNSPKRHAPVSTSSPPPTPANRPDLLQLFSPSRPLHPGTDTCLLQLPPCRCKMKGSYALPRSSLSVQNPLPVHVGNATTTNTFKSTLRPYLSTPNFLNQRDSCFLLSLSLSLSPPPLCARACINVRTCRRNKVQK